MAKPSRKKAATKRTTAKRKPAAPRPVDVVTTAPEPEQPVEPTQEPTPAPAEAQAQPAPMEVAGTDAHSERVSIGPVEARMKRLSLKVVLGLLNPDGLRRIEAEKSTASFESTRQRLLATDGRATPVVFEDGEPPSILHGYSELAAAVDCGLASIDVLLIPTGGASEAQSYIVEMLRQQRMKDQPSTDDDLFYRVHAAD